MQRARGCSLPCIINTSCSLRIDIACICVTETAENTWPYFQLITLKYGVKTEFSNFIICFLYKGDLGAGEKKILCGEGSSHIVKHNGVLGPWAPDVMTKNIFMHFHIFFL